MKKFDLYFNGIMIMSLGCASIGSFISKMNGALIGAIVGGVIGFLIVYFKKL